MHSGLTAPQRNTQWQIFREYTLEEVEVILESVKSKGFSVTQAMLLGVGGPIHPNVNGEMPWNDNDPSSPNDAYFENVDSVMKLAREIGIVNIDLKRRSGVLVSSKALMLVRRMINCIGGGSENGGNGGSGIVIIRYLKYIPIHKIFGSFYLYK
jgi:hypothetical protein